MEFISGNIFIRKAFEASDTLAGRVLDGHKHNFDHTSFVWRGAVRVRATLPDGTRVEREFHAPSHFLVRADVLHEITALEDGTEFWCVYAHRDPQGEVVQIATGWPEAYSLSREPRK